MSGTTTKRMIDAYNQDATPSMFLSGLFQSPAQNFYTSEEVEVDVERGEEEISIIVQDLSTGTRMNAADVYTNKSFKAPIHDEGIPLNSFDLIKRMAGENPFESPDFRANVMTRMFKGMRKIENKIRRSIELQASQVLQTGVLTLTDSDGNTLYTLDYKPKVAHFPTSGTAWGSAGDDPLGDLDALGRVVRSNGLTSPNQLIMGVDAFEAFIKNTDVQARYDNRRIDLGTIAPMQMRGEGGEYRGVVEVGNYRYDIWTYDGRYTHPETSVSTNFVDPDNVILRASSGRMDATFGAVPNIGKVMGVGSTNLLPEMPTRITNRNGGMDLFPNAWLSPDGKQLFGSVAARPLLIPTAIDTYGCLKTVA